MRREASRRAGGWLVASALGLALGAGGCDQGPAICTSSVQCPGRVCDPDTRHCVECVLDTDCLEAGQACLGNACEIAVPCFTSRQCPGRVCDLARGICAECTADRDCPLDRECVHDACVLLPPPCASDAECAALGRICDPSTARCVDCLDTGDCAAGQACSADLRCVAPADGGTPDAGRPPDVGPPDAPPPDAIDAGESCPTVGEMQVIGCGTRCGRQNRLCLAARVWSYGECLEAADACVPGGTRTVTCGTSSMTETCGTDCAWSTAIFACRPPDSRPCTTACGTPGSAGCNAACTGYGACFGPEVCNGCDDDGIGGPDDGFLCRRSAVTSCTTSCGTSGSHVCNTMCSAYGPCTAPEACNGCDDDGNGLADDGFACVMRTLQACTTACGTAGSRICGPTCSLGPCAAPAETCGNGCDDDGNGLVDDGCVPASDLCSGAIALSTGPTETRVFGWTTGAGNEGGCGTGPDVYYRFTLTVPEVVYLDTEGSSFNTTVALTNGCAGHLVCNDDACGGTQSQLAAVLAPGTYYAIVGGAGTAQGSFALRFEHLPTGNGAPVALPRPAVGATLTGTTSGTGTITPSCALAAGPETMLWFTTCNYAGGSFTASACPGTAWDTVLDFRDARGGTAVCDDNGCGLQSTVSGTVSSGWGLRALYVDGNGTAAGSFSIGYTMP